MAHQYSPEEIADVKAREAEAIEMLKKLQLTPSAQIIPFNLGNDAFATRVIPFLQDTKYADAPATVDTTPEKSFDELVNNAEVEISTVNPTNPQPDESSEATA